MMLFPNHHWDFHAFLKPTDIDESKMTYGKKSCESIPAEESLPKPAVIEPKTSENVVCKSKLSDESPEFIPQSVCSKIKMLREKDKLMENQLDLENVKGTRYDSSKTKTKVNPVKALAKWVWKPKQAVLEHVSKSSRASKVLTRYDYVDVYGRFKSVLLGTSIALIRGWMSSVLGSSVSFVTSGSFSTTGGGIGGPSYEAPLRVVMALASFLGFGMVLLGNELELEA
ncbi:hypothetical protein Tco_0443346 [Tanacetum coccineum]